VKVNLAAVALEGVMREIWATYLLKASNAPAEVVWWDAPGRQIRNGNRGATGGGVSTLFERSSWQKVDIASLNAGARTRVLGNAIRGVKTDIPV
jgi:hypothetical protein